MLEAVHSGVRRSTVTARVVEQRPLTPSHYHLVVEAPAIADASRPGMFVMIKCWEEGTFDPFLPRAFSICDMHDGRLEFFYKTWGIATYRLARMDPGDTFELFGPLGVPFDLGDYKHRILVAGGTGTAPFVALLRAIRPGRVSVLLGGRTDSEIFFTRTFKDYKADVQISTEDGTLGHRGFPTEVLEDILKRENPDDLHVSACGPNPMLYKVWDIAKRYRVPCQISIETPMACGVGACLGCWDDHFGVHACFEGPVVSNY